MTVRAASCNLETWRPVPCPDPETVSLTGLDSGIAERANQALYEHPCFRGRATWVHCATRGDHIVISGRVPSFYLKQLAQEVLRRVSGMPPIDNRLEIVHAPGHMKTDHRRQQPNQIGKARSALYN